MVFPETPGKKDNLLRYIEIFENFQPIISVPFDFPHRSSQIFSWMVCFSDFLETFPDNFHGAAICPSFKIFGIFGQMERTPG